LADDYGCILETHSGLMDRDPKPLVDSFMNSPLCHRVVVLGDAVHSMSPFKGAGANQALLDGPLLASWLQRASLPAAIKGFLREMTNRTRPRVLASREAAAYLHSPAVLVPGSDQDFAGVVKDQVAALLKVLEKKNIGASLGADLDSYVMNAIKSVGCQEKAVDLQGKQQLSTDAQRQALTFAFQGDTQGLRTLSLRCEAAVLLARDDRGRTCLHMSAQAKHFHTCKWLLTEACLSPDIKDHDGMTASQRADGNAEILKLIETLSRKV
jgi:FAD binding domain